MGTIQESEAPKNDEALISSNSNNEINTNSQGSDSVNNNENALPSVSDKGGGDTETNNNPASIDSKNGNVASEISKDDDEAKRKNSATLKNVPVPTISRIARPCVGHQKPAVPVTPPQNNSVLTEDTDSFIIGDKVWVGGNKPGQIAYIGETQFAPGEWAGIVLDAPIGKNDGSVGGIRYFQCEAKRGVFSRLTRLTRTPLPGADESFTQMSFTHHTSSTPFNNGTKPRGQSPLSPTGSTRSLRKSPSLSTSNTSLASTTHVVDFKIGDRVIIKSSQGSKVGTLRFMGTTNFAPGEWCGVELDEPRGKNDGSVEGIRYFECKPQFGLFAPVTKVSKSPLKYKPGNCVLHSGAKLPPSGMKRSGSKESMTSFTSMTSSLASATSGARRVRLGVNSLTPQDVLREKQLHIEQLLKERDLERAEFTRAANQADNAEQTLATLQAEYEHYRVECESKLKEYSTVLSHLNVDRGSLLSQLEDEKRKSEDLQFKFEEAAITKGDIEVSNQSNIHRINDLEERLAAERKKVENLEQESSKLFEAEEELVKSREEIDSLKSDLHQLRTKRDVGSQDSVSSEVSSVVTRQTKSQNIKIESSKVIDGVSLGITSSQSTSSDLEKQLEESRKESAVHLQNCDKYQNEVAMLKTELLRTKTLFQEQTATISNKMKISSNTESSLRAELEELKLTLTAKDAELQNKDDEIRRLKTLLETSDIEVKAKAVDIERYQRSKQESEESYNKEIDYLKRILKEKVVEKEQVEKTSAIEISKQKSKLEEASKSIAIHLEEIEKLKSDLSEAKADIERNSVDVHERHTRQIAIKESELMAMAAELQQKNEEISKCSIVTTKLEDDICIKNGIIEKLKLELESFKKRSESEERSMLNYTERISVLQLTVGDLQRTLASTEQIVLELQEQKARLESELQNVIASSGDYSAELQKMNAAVIEKELMITTVRNELLQKLQMQQSNEQQLQLKLQKVTEDYERLEFNLREKLRISQESEDMLRQRCESANGEAIKIRDDLMVKVNQLQRLVEEKDFALKVSAGDHTESVRYLKEQLDRTTTELQKTIDGCQYKINELAAENVDAKNAVAQKSQELIESDAKLKHFMANSQINEEELRRLSDEQIKKLQFDLSEKSALVQQYLTELELLKRDCHNRNVNIAEKDYRISELTVQLENTLKLVNQLQVEKDNLQLSQIETNKQCAIHNQQCTDLLNQVAILSEKAELGERTAQELRMQKSLHLQLIQQIQITETQKQDLIARLDAEAKKSGEADKCYSLLELAKNIQLTTNNEHTRKISELQEVLENTQLKCEATQKQVETQKEEILSLQNELLSAQQSCGPKTNTVSKLPGHTPTINTFLQIQLVNLKHSYTQLLQRFVGSQRLNVYLINKLERAVSNGDGPNIQKLLREFIQLKQYLTALQGSIEQDKFKFEKIISYALLSLHKKQVEITVQNNYIRKMQTIYNSLPTQCKLLQSNTVDDFISESPNEAQIELEKTIQLIRLKDEHIQNLKVQIVSIQDNCRNLFNAKCPVRPDSEVSSLQPAYCEPPRVLIRNVPVIRYVPQSCEQIYPDYIRHQPVFDQTSPKCAPAQVIVQKVPVYVPRIAIKDVPRYVNEHFKCPAPQVIYQKVPIPLPPKVVYVQKPLPVPSISHVPELNPTWPLNQLKLQIQNLAHQLRVCKMAQTNPTIIPPTINPNQDEQMCKKHLEVIRNQEVQINILKEHISSCGRQDLIPTDLIGNEQPSIGYLLSIIENLKNRCLHSNQIPNECMNVVIQHKTLLSNLESVSRDILQLINVNPLPDRVKAAVSRTKFERLIIEVNRNIIVSGQSTQCEDVITQQINKLHVLRSIIRNNLPLLNNPVISPVEYLSLLRLTITQFLAQLDSDVDLSNGPYPLDDYEKCSNALVQQQVRINSLTTIIQGMLQQLNNVQLSDLAKINMLRAQIQNLLVQLNNNKDFDIPQGPNSIEAARLKMQVDNLIRELNLCRFSKTQNGGIYPEWDGSSRSSIYPQSDKSEQENVYLRYKVQELLVQLNTLSQNCNNRFRPSPELQNEITFLKNQIQNLLIQLRFYKSYQRPGPERPANPSEINFLRLKIHKLTQELNNAKLHPQCSPQLEPIFNQQCPQTPSFEQETQINILKNQIQNLLTQLRMYKLYPTTTPVASPSPAPTIITPDSRNFAEINMLKAQIFKLTQELNYARLQHPPTLNPECPPPRVAIQRIPVPVSSLQPQNTNQFNSLIENLFNQLRLCRMYRPERQYPSPTIATTSSTPDFNEINILKLQIFKLKQELNNCSPKTRPNMCPPPRIIPIPQVPSFENQCPPPRIILQKVPVPQLASNKELIEINILKNQIHNLLMQLRFHKLYPRPKSDVPLPIIATPSTDVNNEIYMLKLQIYKLTQQLNYLILNPQCSSLPGPIVNKQCPPPKVLHVEDQTLKNQIQNLFTQLRLCRLQPTPTPEVQSTPPWVIPTPDSIEINALKLQLYELKQELNNAIRYPKCPIQPQIPVVIPSPPSVDDNWPAPPTSDDWINENVMNQCPPPKVLIRHIPVLVPSAIPISSQPGPNYQEIDYLNQKIQYLLYQLNNKRCELPETSCIPQRIVVPVPLPNVQPSNDQQQYVIIINSLRAQVNQLVVELNNVRQQITLIRGQCEKQWPYHVNINQLTDINDLKSKVLYLLKQLISIGVSPGSLNIPCEPVSSPTRIIVRPIPVSSPSRIIIRPVPTPPQVIVRPVPVFQPQTNVRSPPRIIIRPVPVLQPTPPQVILRPVPVPQPSPPRYIVRTVPIPQPSPPRLIIRPVPVVQPSPPQVIIRQIPVPQPSAPRIIIRPVPVLQPSLQRVVVRPVPVPVPVPQPSPPRLIIRPIPITQRSPPQIIIRPVPIPQPSPPQVIVQPIPVPQPIPPRIIIRPVPVPQPSPPQVIVRPIPVSQPSEARIIIRPVPIPQLSPSRIIERPIPVPISLPSAPQVIVRPIPVSQPSPPQVIVRPVYVPRIIIRPVPVLQQYVKEVVRPIPIPVPQPSPPRIIVRPVPVIQQSTPQVVVRPVPVIQPSAPKILIRPVPIPQPSPPRIIIRPIPVPQPSQPEVVVRPIPVPVPHSQVIIRTVPVSQPSPPRIIIKPVPVPQPSQPEVVVRPVNVPVPSSPRVIIRPVPVPVPIAQPSLPRLIMQPVPVLQPSKPEVVVRPVPVPVPVFQPSKPQVVVRPVTVPVPQPSQPEVLFRPVSVPVPVLQPSQSQIVLRPVPVPVPISQPSPPRIIIRPEVVVRPVPIPIQQTSPPQVIVRPIPVPVPQPSEPQVIVHRIPVPQPSPPRIIIRPIPVPQPSPTRTVVKTVYIPQPSPKPILRFIPVPQPSTTNTVPVLVPVPIPKPSLPRIIIKTVPIPQPTPPRIIVRPVPVPEITPGRTVIRPVFVPQPVPVPQQYPPKTIIKPIYISQPSPPKIIIRPVPVPQQSVIQPVPVPQPSPPRVIIKPVFVSQPSPPRFIIRPIPVPQPSQQPIIQPPQIVTKTVYVPQPSPIRIISRPVPGPIRTIIKTVPVSVPPHIRTVIQQIPISQQSPPRIISIPVPQQCEPQEKPILVPVAQPSIQQQIEINSLRAQIQQLTVQLNNAIQISRHIPSPINKNEDQIVLLQEQIQNLLQQLSVCNLHQPTRIIPTVVPSQMHLEEVTELKLQIQNLLHQLENATMYPSPEQEQQIAILKNQVQNLLVQISKIIQIKSLRGECPSPNFVIKRVPIYLQSLQDNKHINILKQEIQNLLMHLNSRPNIVDQSGFVPSPSQQYEVNILKMEIQNLVNKLNLLQMECYNQRRPCVNITPQLPIAPPNPDFSQPCPTPEVKYVPIYQQPQTLIKEVPVPIPSGCVPIAPQPPRIVIKHVPVTQIPKIIIQKVLVPIGSSCPPTEFKVRYIPIPVGQNCPLPNVIVQRIPILQPPRNIVREVPIPQIVVKEVSVSQPPRIVIKKVPVFQKELCEAAYPPKTIIKEVPVPLSSSTQNYCAVPKYVIQQVPVIQPPKIIVKTIPLTAPPREIVKIVRVPFGQENPCPPPQIITQRIPIIQTRTVIKEVPISQPPRIIIKQIPVPQAPQVILKKVPVIVGPNVECPTPQVIVDKVEVPQSPRIIIKQVPITLPPRVIVQQVPKYVYVPSDTPNKDVIPGSPDSLIKEVVVPIDSRGECVPKVIIHNVPINQPPRIIVKNIPVVMPPKIIIKKIPVGSDVSCRTPEVIVRPVPIIQPPRTILKEVPQPPKIIIKEVPVVQPRVEVKYVPVPIKEYVECPRPQVIVQKVLVPQPPRTIVVGGPGDQPPRVIVKEVFVPRPPQIILKELPQIVPGGIFPDGDSTPTTQEVAILRLEIRDLTNRLRTCMRDNFGDGSFIDNIIPVRSLPQCVSQLERQKIIIKQLNFKLMNPGRVYKIPGRFNGILGGINKGGYPSLIDYPSPLGQNSNEMPSSSLNLPLPMLNLLKSKSHFNSKSKNRLQTLFLKVLHEAFTYTQSALSKCMNAVLIQQLAIQTDNDDVGLGGDRRLIEDKEMAEGQIQFLNSIIVDMQRKSQEQQARIELLESGYSPSAADELKLIGLPQAHQRPPRVYCDICELFDDHETEDCPLQASGVDGIGSPSYSRRPRATESNRSYCEICEIFGHCTEDCKEDQTF